MTPTTLGLSTDSTHREVCDSIRRVQQEDHPGEMPVVTALVNEIDSILNGTRQHL